jgi:hypothetical protein
MMYALAVCKARWTKALTPRRLSSEAKAQLGSIAMSGLKPRLPRGEKAGPSLRRGMAREYT